MRLAMPEGTVQETRVAIQISHPGVNHMEGKKRMQMAWGSVGVKSPPSTKGLEDMKNY